MTAPTLALAGQSATLLRSWRLYKMVRPPRENIGVTGADSLKIAFQKNLGFDELCSMIFRLNDGICLHHIIRGLRALLTIGPHRSRGQPPHFT